MSAEMMRRAAEKIRADQHIEENLGHIDAREYATWLAVADWLESEATAKVRADQQYPKWAPFPFEHASAVAAAYLGHCRTCDNYGLVDGLEPCPTCAGGLR